MVKPNGKRVENVRKSRRKRRGLVIERHRASVLPIVERRLPFRDARLEIELEEKDAHHDVRDLGVAIARQERCEQAAFEQKVVPLKGEERARADRVAEIEK